jgi:uncharacterized protein (DUF1501 family)
MSMSSRRDFLRMGLGSGVALGLAALPGVSFAAPAAGDARLVVVILRGALDGLTLVPPFGDGDYAGIRGPLAIARPGAPKGALDLDGFFGLHPALPQLYERWRARELIVVHATASPYRERSHFDGQKVLESGFAQTQGGNDGWPGRALHCTPARIVRPDAGRALGSRGSAPLILRGGRLERAVRVAAGIMRGEGAPEIAVLEAGGLDTHANQGAADGTLAGRLRDLDQALQALARELGTLWQSTAVLIVTEFGRAAAMNGMRGTDHGTGTCCFALGGAVTGGRVIADWPGLARTDLLEGRDLRPTADLRSVFKAVLADHLRIDRSQLERSVFPDSAKAKPFPGLIKA